MKSIVRSSVLFNLTIAYIYFFSIVVGFVFICSDREYNLNQQMARGYITSDSVFFDFEDPSIKQLGDYGTDNTEEYNPDFILENPVCDEGITSVEKMLSSSNSDYFAALHKDILRAIYYNGDVTLPPLISGRFFTEDECLSKTCLAVIGRNKEDKIHSENGKKIYDYNGRQYEVIGIAGVAGESALDDIMFVNIGSLSSEEQLDGMYYIDGAKSNRSVYQEISGCSADLFGCDMKTRKTPVAFIDIASGKFYMKDYLCIVLLGLMLLSYGNIERQYIERSKLKVSVMKLCGISLSKIIKKTSRSYVISSLCGIAVGIVALAIVLLSGVFILEYLYMVKVGLLLLAVSLLLLILGELAYSAVVCKISPQEVIRKV